MIHSFRSEGFKFISNPWCLSSSFFSTFLAPIVLFFLMNQNNKNITSDDMTFLLLCLLYYSQAGLIIGSAVFTGEEYAQSSLRTSFLGIPNRIKWLASKVVVLLVVTVVIFIVSNICSIGIISFFFHKTISFTFFVQRAPMILISRSKIFPVAIFLPLLLGLSQMVQSFLPFVKYFPDLAIVNLFQMSDITNFLPSSYGIFLQFAWLFVLGIFAIGLLNYRDVQ